MRDPFLDWLDTQINNAKADAVYAEEKDPTNIERIGELWVAYATLCEVRDTYLSLRKMFPHNPIWPNIRLPDHLQPRWTDPEKDFTPDDARFME